MGMVLPVPRFTIDMLDDFPDDGNRYELLEGTVVPGTDQFHKSNIFSVFWSAAG